MARGKVKSYQRKTPSQARSRETCKAILQAAAHIIEVEGEAAFTSNRIAERAGVSIGSLYQYFPDKQAILFAIAEDEETKLQCASIPSRLPDEQKKSPLRAGIRAYINMLPDHPKTRKLALNFVLKKRGPFEVARLTDKRFEDAGAYTGLSGAERFVLSRSIVGVVQAAVREERDDITSPEFEDALVRLAQNFIQE